MTNHGSIDVDVSIDGAVNGTVQEGSGGGTRNYERLTNKPQINDVELVGNKSLRDLGIVNNEQPDWEQDDTEAEDYIKNKPEIPSAQVQSDWNEADNTKPDFIKNKPTIPPEQVNSDWNAVSGKAQILNKPTIPSVIANPGNTTENLTSIGIDGTNYAIQGGGGGAVDSVNGKTGAVILDATDVGALPDSTPLFSGDYNDLSNKPTIPDDLADLNDDSTHRLVTDTEKTTWNGKSDFSGSYTDLTDKPTLGTASAKDYVNSVVDGSSDLVTSDAVHDYVDSAISGVYKPSGNKTCAELLPALLIASNLGNVYNMTDSGVTTSDFVEGAGKTIEIGDNVVIVDVGTQNNASYKFDLLSGMVDLSNYIQKSATSGFMKNDGSVDTNSYATTSQIPDITGKADKVTSATNGHLAGLDSTGNLTDSGLSAGNTSIASIGDGTVSGAISALANTVLGYFSYDATEGNLYYTPYSGSPYVFSISNGNLYVDTVNTP